MPTRTANDIVSNIAGWDYDPERDSYTVDGTRRSSAWVRDYVENTLVAQVRADMQGMTERMRVGEMTVARWYTDMQGTVRVLHEIAALAALGPYIDQVPMARQDIAGTIERELGYLRVFHHHVIEAKRAQRQQAKAMGPLAAAAGLAVQAAGWVRRASSYADAGLVTYERHRWYLAVHVGLDQARRVLSEAEHCDGCVREAEKGWVRATDLVPLGYEECGQWCKCTVEYKRGAASSLADTIWRSAWDYR